MTNIIKTREIDLTDDELALLSKLRNAIRKQILADKRKHRGINGFALNLEKMSGKSDLTSRIIQCITEDLQEDGWEVRTLSLQPSTIQAVA